LLFARSPGTEIGITENFEAIPIEKMSSMTQFMMNRDSGFWTRYNILLLAIAIEHIIIGLKALIAILIPDVSTHVMLAEKQRKEVIESALKEMEKYKHKSNIKDLEEEVKGVKENKLLVNVRDSLGSMLKNKFQSMSSGLLNSEGTLS